MKHTRLRSINKRYPGRRRPNYTGPKSGIFFLIHHGKILEYSHDIFERLDYIDKTKSRNEIAWRRHCMVYVKPSELPPGVVKALATRKKADATWEKAYATREKAAATWERADATWWTAAATWKKVLTAHNDSLTALLVEHVPDHTWNGTELIFK